MGLYGSQQDNVFYNEDVFLFLDAKVVFFSFSQNSMLPLSFLYVRSTCNSCTHYLLMSAFSMKRIMLNYSFSVHVSLKNGKYIITLPSNILRFSQIQFPIFQNYQIYQQGQMNVHVVRVFYHTKSSDLYDD